MLLLCSDGKTGRPSTAWLNPISPSEGSFVSERVLFRGGHVLTMDPEAGDIFGGDVLVEGEQIAAVGRDLEVGDAEVVDATGSIVIPGFID